MLPQLSLFQQCSIQSQDLMQTWLHWRHQDALLVQKHFVALFHPKPNECLRFDLESCNLHTLLLPTHACHIPPLAQARPVMLCIYTSLYDVIVIALYAGVNTSRCELVSECIYLSTAYVNTEKYETDLFYCNHFTIYMGTAPNFVYSKLLPIPYKLT